MCQPCEKGAKLYGGLGVSCVLSLPSFTAEIPKFSKIRVKFLTEATSVMWKCNWKIQSGNDPEKTQLFTVYHWVLFAKETQTVPSKVPPSYVHILSSLAAENNNKTLQTSTLAKAPI